MLNKRDTIFIYGQHFNHIFEKNFVNKRIQNFTNEVRI